MIEISERANLKQIAAQLASDIDEAGWHLEEGARMDDAAEASRHFGHGCLRILMGFGIVAVAFLELLSEEK